MGKKGGKGKGKKGKGTEGPEVVTTRQMLRERERCMCPRLGDAAERAERADAIRMEVVYFKLKRCLVREQGELDLSRSNLAFVPEDLRIPELGAQLIALDLSHNQLFGSGHVFDVCSGLGLLKRLNLSHNNLNGPLSEAACAHFPGLEEVALDANQLTALPEGLGVWTKMRKFSASKNFLKELPPAAAEAWKELRSLNLRNNQLEVMPQIGEAWAQCEVLYLGSNQLKECPDVSALVNLKELDLRSNQLGSVPGGLEKCVQLVKLHLGNNKITDLPAAACAALDKLEELHLYRNKLEHLPAEVGNLGAMSRLTLSSTNLRTLPETISECTSLKELYVNNCAKFSSLPTSSGDLINLEELQAKKCPALKTLPSTAIAWKNLKELDVSAANPKKQVCKLPPELTDELEKNQCKIRGGVKPKAKKGKKGK